MGKLPPRGLVDIEFFDDKAVLTISRNDGARLSITLTIEELENLGEYIRNVLMYKKAGLL